jgi:hypothetical protein
LRTARRIVVLCEGDSEELASKYFLRRQLDQAGLKPVGLHPVNLFAKLEDVFVKTRKFHADTRVLAVFTLIDLYGMNRVNHRPEATLDEKVTTVRDWLRSGVQDIDPEFFHPHVSVHDLEAWFLAEGRSLGKRIGLATLRPDPHAETRDFEKPPKRHVNELFIRHRNRGYDEVRDGTPMFRDLEHAPVYETCRHYRALYDDLVDVASRALAS